jgi:hypothetical protein
MKKNFLYLAIACIAFAFTACGDDDDKDTAQKVADIIAQDYDSEAMDIELEATDDSKPLPFTKLSLMTDGQVLIGPIAGDQVPHAQTRGSYETLFDGQDYIWGYYESDDEENAVLIYTDKDEPICAFIFGKKDADGNYNITDLVGVRMSGAEDLIPCRGTKKVDKNEVTSVLCKTPWKVKYSRIRHTGGVTAVCTFDPAIRKEDPASLNDILDYALTKADINETFDENMVIDQVIFTRGHTFAIKFKNKKNYVGTWEWENRSKGFIAYNWEKATMGNAFESGEAVFDIRSYNKQQYYTLTLGADIVEAKNFQDKPKSYHVELSFFLVQKFRPTLNKVRIK